MAHTESFLTASSAEGIVNASLWEAPEMARCSSSSQVSRGCLRAYGSGALRRAAAARSRPSAQPTTNLTKLSPCSGCSFAIDLTCSHRLRLASFHKFFDCLLPNFQRIQLVHSLRVPTDERLCLLVEDDRSYATFAVQALLGGVLVGHGSRWSGSNGSSSNHTIWRVERPDGGGPTELVLLHTLLGSAHECVAALPRVPSSTSLAAQLLGPRGSAQAALSTRAIHALVSRQLAPQESRADAVAEAHVILIQRVHSRTFLSLSTIAAALQRATGRVVRVYFGNESSLATLRLFASASAVVGTHGAGLVNALWIPHRACVLEVSSIRSSSSQ